MPVPVHQLDTAESYLAVLDGFPQAFEPGADFAYCNGGYVVLALLAERAAGVPFHDLVQRHVIDRAGLPGRRTCAPTPCPATPRSATSTPKVTPTSCAPTSSTCRSWAAATGASSRPPPTW